MEKKEVIWEKKGVRQETEKALEEKERVLKENIKVLEENRLIRHLDGKKRVGNREKEKKVAMEKIKVQPTIRSNDFLHVVDTKLGALLDSNGGSSANR